MRISWTQVSLALLAGILVGWFAGQRALKEETYGWKGEKMVERFSRELRLTPDQKEKVAQILESKRQQIAALRDQIRPRFEEVRNTSKAEIQKLLSPDQQQRFEKLQARWEASRRKRHAEWAEK